VPQSRLEGSLAFPTWIQVAELEDLTGNASFNDTIRIGFRRGRIVGAEVDGTSGLDGLLAAFLSNPSQGALSDGDPVDHGLNLDATGALLTGLRLVDEWERLQAQVLSPTTDTAPDKLAPVWSSFDGERTTAEVLFESGLPLGTLVDAVAGAVEDGMLRPSGKADPERAKAAMQPVRAEDFWTLMDQAHDLTRARDYAGAERTLRMALRARPNDPLATQNLRRLERLAQRG